jgi:hypothetical protein
LQKNFVELRELFVNASNVFASYKIFQQSREIKKFCQDFCRRNKSFKHIEKNSLAIPKSFSSFSVNSIERCKNILSKRIKISRLSAKHLTNCRPWYASVSSCLIVKVKCIKKPWNFFYNKAKNKNIEKLRKWNILILENIGNF